jgi:hypothetical protein
MEQTRNLGFAKWKDPQAWMERMKGPGWRNVLKEEGRRFQDFVAKTPDVPDFEIELSLYQPTEANGRFETEGGEIIVVPKGTLNYEWRYATSTEYHHAAELDAKKGGHLWTVKDIGSGGELYECEYLKNERSIWKLKGVGPFIGIYKNRCYLVEADRLWYHTLISVNAMTGKDKRVHYRETDGRWNLKLERLQDETLALIANNAGTQKLWAVTEDSVVSMYPSGVSFVPVTHSSAFVRYEGQDEYEGKGILSDFRFPNFKTQTPEWMSVGRGLLITRSMGERFLWKVSRSSQPVLTKKIVGSFMPDPWVSPSILILEPGAPRYSYTEESCPYAKYKKYTTDSKDGTKVSLVYVCSSNVKKPEAALVIGYGAYGIPTVMSTSRWRPLLSRGWCIVFALIRGSGDDTDAWAEAARRDQKVKSIEDFEACLRKVKSITGLGPDKTVIYGRSAGGYLVGAALGRNPNGELFRAVYTEVPYVDVLRTTTNPLLPLTKLEYEEFGDPATRLQDFGAVLHLSPIDLIPKEGIPNVFVLCRTASLDMEVLAYESVKWIRKLRGKKGEPKLLALTAGEGHFAKGPSALKQQAQDLAILDFVMRKKSNPRIYKMMMPTRKNRKNNLVSRKNRKNNLVSRKNRKNNLVSRKNRKNRTERKNRKNRMNRKN